MPDSAPYPAGLKGGKTQAVGLETSGDESIGKQSESANSAIGEEAEQ